MVKGNKRENTGESKKYVGFTSVKVVAVNPTREELNKLLGAEGSEDDKPLEYLSEDTDGNKRVRLSVWLHDSEINKYFPYSFFITNKEFTNKDGSKNQYINSTCSTTWVDNEKNLPEWFTNFTTKKDKDGNYDVLGQKVVRKALVGEADLANLMRAWLGRLNWMEDGTEVSIDPSRLLAGNFSELREHVDGDYSTPFVVLVGVKTDKEDATKQYQQVFGKSFLPDNFLPFIKNGNKFPSDYAKKIWDRFENEATGEYGFSSYFELVPLTEYDSTKDIAVSGGTNKEAVTVNNSKY